MADDFILLGPGGDDPLERGLALLLYARCCTSLSDEDAEQRMNLENPTGISSRWSLCTEEPKAPVQCCDDANRRHLMFSC